jgi:hypothetical protein
MRQTEGGSVTAIFLAAGRGFSVAADDSSEGNGCHDSAENFPQICHAAVRFAAACEGALLCPALAELRPIHAPFSKVLRPRSLHAIVSISKMLFQNVK